MSGRSRSYKVGLYRRLADDEEAAVYLQTALEDSQAAFLVALRNVVDARTLAEVAQVSGLNREHLYRMLTSAGDPKMSTLSKLLATLGLRIQLVPVRDAGGETNIQWHAPKSPRRVTERVNPYASGLHLVRREKQANEVSVLSLLACSINDHEPSSVAAITELAS